MKSVQFRVYVDFSRRTHDTQICQCFCVRSSSCMYYFSRHQERGNVRLLSLLQSCPSAILGIIATIKVFATGLLCDCLEEYSASLIGRQTINAPSCGHDLPPDCPSTPDCTSDFALAVVLIWSRDHNCGGRDTTRPLFSDQHPIKSTRSISKTLSSSSLRLLSRTSVFTTASRRSPPPS